jgi:hypothetical protein
MNPAPTGAVAAEAVGSSALDPHTTASGARTAHCAQAVDADGGRVSPARDFAAHFRAPSVTESALTPFSRLTSTKGYLFPRASCVHAVTTGPPCAESSL